MSTQKTNNFKWRREMKRLKGILAVCLVLGLGVVFIVGRGKVYKGKDKEVRESISLSDDKEGMKTITAPSDTEPPQSYKEPGEGSITGRVIGEDTREGVSNASLSLFELLTDEKHGKIRGSFHRYVDADDNGDYSFNNIPPGDYRIFYGDNKDHSQYVGTKHLVDYIDVVMPDEGGGVRIPDIVLEVGGKVRVRVFKADGKTLMDEDKVVGVFVNIANYKGTHWNGSTRGMIKAIREKDGTYLISRVPETDSAELEAWVYGYGNVMKKGIKVKAGKITDVIDIIINTDDPTGITGVVTAKADGQPIEGARVDIDIPGRPTDPATNSVALAITDKDGQYIIRGMQPGFYSIYSLHASFNALSKTKPIEVIKGKQTAVNVKLPPRAQEGTGSNVTYAEDPVAEFPSNSGCSDEQIDAIGEAFNAAMIRFQEPDCVPSRWNQLNAKGHINIYCELCGGCAQIVKGSYRNMSICMKTVGGGTEFQCSNLSPSILHESLHLVGLNEDNAWTCQYKCYGKSGGGCVACVPKTAITVSECRGEELTMGNSCDTIFYDRPACPNPNPSEVELKM